MYRIPIRESLGRVEKSLTSSRRGDMMKESVDEGSGISGPFCREVCRRLKAYRAGKFPATAL